MNTRGKQRILGIVVLVAIAVVVLPMLFHRPDANTNKATTTRAALSEQHLVLNNQVGSSDSITLQTQAAAALLQKHNQSLTHLSPSPASTKPAMAAAVSKPEVSKPPVVASKLTVAERALARSPVAPLSAKQAEPIKLSTNLNKPIAAYTIQLGAFHDAQNVKHLVGKLRSRGYDVYVKKIQHAGSELHMVFVGPELTQQKAKNTQLKLERDMHIRGVIRHYYT